MNPNCPERDRQPGRQEEKTGRGFALALHKESTLKHTVCVLCFVCYLRYLPFNPISKDTIWGSPIPPSMHVGWYLQLYITSVHRHLYTCTCKPNPFESPDIWYICAVWMMARRWWLLLMNHAVIWSLIDIITYKKIYHKCTVMAASSAPEFRPTVKGQTYLIHHSIRRKGKIPNDTLRLYYSGNRVPFRK